LRLSGLPHGSLYTPALGSSLRSATALSWRVRRLLSSVLDAFSAEVVALLVSASEEATIRARPADALPAPLDAHRAIVEMLSMAKADQSGLLLDEICCLALSTLKRKASPPDAAEKEPPLWSCQGALHLLNAYMGVVPPAQLLAASPSLLATVKEVRKKRSF
jgi:hypothetical protein